MSYNETDYLQLSGIQHFSFCRRQWALIHIENQWAENLHTTEGKLMHERAHDASLRERRGDLLTVRDMRFSSAELGLSGACDVVEYHRTETGVPLSGLDGLWQPYPVEYKRGGPKAGNEDRLQLCAQAMCLEEMLCCDIPEGALYYAVTCRREKVRFSEELRREVRDSAAEMPRLYERGYTPKVKPSKACGACSLNERCTPKLMRLKPVSAYLAEAAEEKP